MKRLPTILALVILAPILAWPAPEKRIALVIGNGSYAKVPRLVNPVNDATDMAAKLAELGFSVTRLVDTDLAGMEAARRSFAEEARGAAFRLFYFAGHGVQAEGLNWLLPVDADIREDYELKQRAFSAQALLDGLKAAGPGINLILLDACRDNPFPSSARSASRGLAVMGLSGSLVAFATAPGSTAADGSDRNGVFTEALLRRLDSPGLSLQEIMTNVAADVVARTNGAQEPWKQDNLTRMVYFVSPEEAQARFAQRIAKSQAEYDAAAARLASLQRQLAAEQDAARKATLDLEITMAAALQAQKQKENEALKGEQARQEEARKSQAAMEAQLAAYKAEAADREESLRRAAEAKRRELETLQREKGGALPFILTMESARTSRAELSRQYEESLKTVQAAVGGSYDKKLAAVQAWTMDPWENAEEFKERVTAESSRLQSERQAGLVEAKAQSDTAQRSALQPFLEAEREAIQGLEAVTTAYTGSSVKVEVGAFDTATEAKHCPITNAGPPPPPFSRNRSQPIHCLPPRKIV